MQPTVQAWNYHLEAGAISQREERDGHPGHAPLRLRPALPGGPRNEDSACRQQPHSAHPDWRCVWCQHLQHVGLCIMLRTADPAPARHGLLLLSGPKCCVGHRRGYIDLVHLQTTSAGLLLCISSQVRVKRIKEPLLALNATMEVPQKKNGEMSSSRAASWPAAPLLRSADMQHSHC